MLVCQANQLRIGAPGYGGNLLPVNIGPGGIDSSTESKDFLLMLRPDWLAQ